VVASPVGGRAVAGRTIAIGDVHGDLHALETLFSRLPVLDRDDTLVFLGDYVDRGPHSAEVVQWVRRKLPLKTKAKIVTLRGNHEDAWLKVIDEGWPGFLLPPQNGCLACLRSFRPGLGQGAEAILIERGEFFPPDVVKWMRTLPFWYEDDHAIYVHAGLPSNGDAWSHPSEAEDPQVLLWTRTQRFFTDYHGKTVVVGHTVTNTLPPELSDYTPEDPDDLFWAGNDVFCLDTGAGKGGFLTALELPSGHVWESR